MSTDSAFAIFSTTKAITATAALQLVEEDKLDLDAPASRYAPDIGTLQVIDGFDDNGEPQLRAPKRDITTRMLLLHTAGFGYDFFNETYNRLDELGIESMTFELNDALCSRLATMHARNDDGSLSPVEFELTDSPEVHMGGHGLYGTVGDYMRFIRMFPGLPKSWSLSFMVNDEDAPTGRPAGALGWAGLANLFYWIDRQHGHGGFWATQTLPFADAASFTGYMDFETAWYDAQGVAQAA